MYPIHLTSLSKSPINASKSASLAITRFSLLSWNLRFCVSSTSPPTISKKNQCSCLYVHCGLGQIVWWPCLKIHFTTSLYIFHRKYFIHDRLLFVSNPAYIAKPEGRTKKRWSPGLNCGYRFGSAWVCIGAAPVSLFHFIFSWNAKRRNGSIDAGSGINTRLHCLFASPRRGTRKFQPLEKNRRVVETRGGCLLRKDDLSSRATYRHAPLRRLFLYWEKSILGIENRAEENFDFACVCPCIYRVLQESVAQYLI